VESLPRKISFVVAVLSLLAAGALADQLAAREARQKIADALGMDKADGVHIRSISSGLASDAVVEVTIDAAFHLDKDRSGNWIVKEVRTGDRRWESIDLIRTAIQKEKVLRTAADMRTLAGAIDAFRRDKGGYVTAETGRALVDALYPAYLTPIIRLDAWSNEFEYRGSRNGYRLASSGPDGQPGTGDDIVIENGSLVSGADRS
jgi:type II secretion system (T2SS) protein G